VALKSSELRNVGIEDDLVTARSSAFTPRINGPSRGEYEGATTPMASPSGDCRRANETTRCALLKSDRVDLELFVCRQR
jgi:hypothetical protein